MTKSFVFLMNLNMLTEFSSHQWSMHRWTKKCVVCFSGKNIFICNPVKRGVASYRLALKCTARLTFKTCGVVLYYIDNNEYFYNTENIIYVFVDCFFSFHFVSSGVSHHRIRLRRPFALREPKRWVPKSG